MRCDDEGRWSIGRELGVGSWVQDGVHAAACAASDADGTGDWQELGLAGGYDGVYDVSDCRLLQVELYEAVRCMSAGGDGECTRAVDVDGKGVGNGGVVGGYVSEGGCCNIDDCEAVEMGGSMGCEDAVVGKGDERCVACQPVGNTPFRRLLNKVKGRACARDVHDPRVIPALREKQCLAAVVLSRDRLRV